MTVLTAAEARSEGGSIVVYAGSMIWSCEWLLRRSRTVHQTAVISDASFWRS